MAHKFRFPTTVPLRHRWNVSLSGAAKVRGTRAAALTQLCRRTTSSFICCVCRAVEVLRFKTPIAPRGSFIHRYALSPHNRCTSLRRASAMASARFVGAISPKGASCALQILAIQCNRRVGKSRGAGHQALANQSLNRTLHSRQSFGPPFHSGPNATLLFRAG